MTRVESLLRMWERIGERRREYPNQQLELVRKEIYRRCRLQLAEALAADAADAEAAKRAREAV